MLTTDSQVPVVTKTTVGSDLSESYQIVTEDGGERVGKYVLGLSGGEILLSVEEPGRDLEFGRFRHNVNNLLEFLRGNITSAKQ